MKPHPDIRKLVRFFPSILITSNNYEHGLRSFVKHGDEKSPHVDYSKDGIMNWINDNISNFF